ncbi:hypothetical protein [Prevotella melaninogenica]|jgi:hypothetical protein
MKKYIITLSKFFLKQHIRAGEETGFKDSFLKGKKVHTIRANYNLWEARIKEVQEGKAVLSIRQWSGLPYRSKQDEITELSKEDGVGIQKLTFNKDSNGEFFLEDFDIDGKYIDFDKLAANDGLLTEDWYRWFKKYDLSKPMAVIHFTSFRY